MKDTRKENGTGVQPDSVWVFGYGSLMWRPGFTFLRAIPALLFGYHRSLCVYSHQYRGTPDKPGLVFGLDRGGSCHGMAFEVAGRDWPETLAYLREREQLTNVYIELVKQVRVAEGAGARPALAPALAFVVNRAHAQYAGKLATQDILRLIRQGHGKFGPCEDYVRNTVQHLRDLDILDRGLERLMTELDGH
jgi:glutathione-specific gamma-glutamylcyclotransferase